MDMPKYARRMPDIYKNQGRTSSTFASNAQHMPKRFPTHVRSTPKTFLTHQYTIVEIHAKNTIRQRKPTNTIADPDKSRNTMTSLQK